MDDITAQPTDEWKAAVKGVKPMQGDTKTEWLTFGEAHDSVWEAAPPTIGLTLVQAEAYTDLVRDARTKYDLMIVARNASKAATQNWYTAANAMRDNASNLITIIKGFANTQADPNAVYSAAQIPPPAVPTPAGPPVDCTDLSAELTNSGNVELSWKGSLSSGQYFSMWRRLASESDYTLIGTVAAKKFLDTELPPGAAWASYQVKAQRGTQISQGCEPVSILFGALQMAA